MKTKNLVIIFILFLLITLASGLVVYLTKEKSGPIVSEQISVIEKQAESIPAEMVAVATSTEEKAVRPEKIGQPKIISAPAEEKINAVMLINGAKYEAAVKPGSSVYDLMNLLKMERKIDFSGKDYAGLGFFVEAINGVKNNPAGLPAQAGKNWLYYVNGKPAPVGVSNYIIKANDIIEWKYENKSF